MNKIKEFTKGAIGGAFEAAVCTFPPTAIVWGAIKGGVNAIRTERANVFVSYIVENFEISDFNNPLFIDGLSLTFEAYLKERVEKKRKIIKKIFLDYKKGNCAEEYELEKLYYTLGIASLDDIKRVKSFPENYLVEVENNEMEAEKVSSLISLGLVKTCYKYERPSYHLGEYYEDSRLAEDVINTLRDSSPDNQVIEYKLTEFGKKFLSFIE